MKTLVIVIILLVLFVCLYTFVLVKIGYGVMDYDEYQNYEPTPEDYAKYKYVGKPKPSFEIKVYGVKE